MKHFWYILIVLMAALTPAWAWAGASVYTDRASFEAAIGPHVTYTFEKDDGFPTAPVPISSFGPVIATSGAADGGPAFIRNFPGGATNQTLSGDFEGYPTTNTLFIRFSTKQYAIGFDDYPYGAPANIGVSYQGNDGGYDQYFILPFGNLDDSVFFGLISEDPILNVYIRSLADSKGQRYKGIDNLTIIPEPCATGLLWPLAAVLFWRRRSQSERANSICPRLSAIEPLESRRLLSTSFTFAGTNLLSVGRDTNISQSSGNQAEEAIAVDPIDPAKMFTFSNGAITMFAVPSFWIGAFVN